MNDSALREKIQNILLNEYPIVPDSLIEAILKAVAESLPEEYGHNDKNDSPCDCSKVEGWNAYRNEVLKLLGEEL